jgi:hypothetical protein
MFALPLIGVCAAPASAAYVHPVRTESFQLLEEPYNSSGGEPGAISYDPSTKHLYVNRPGVYECCNGVPQPQPPRGIYAFDMSVPGEHTMLGGNFPISAFAGASNLLEVDREQGTIYTLSPGQIVGHDSLANELGGVFPFSIEAGLTDPQTDGDGYLWFRHAGGDAYNEETKEFEYTAPYLAKYNPDTGALVASFYPTQLHQLEGMAIDRRTGNIWGVGYKELGSAVGLQAWRRLTAASGYTESDAVLPEVPAVNAVDSKHGVLYFAGTRQGKTFTEDMEVVEAYNEDGALIERVELGVPFPNRIHDIAVEEETGTIYLSTGTQVAVYDGVVVPDVTTQPAANIGHASAVLNGHVDPAGGPGIEECEFQYLAADDLDEVQTVTLNGATGGTFEIGWPNAPDSKPIPYNASAAEVQITLEEYGWAGLAAETFTVSGSTGGPYTIRFMGDLGDTDLRTLQAPASGLTPSGATATVTTVNDGGQTAWKNDASSTPCTPAASEGSPLEAPTDVEAELSGLETGVEYRYRLVATNANGHNIGLEEDVIPQPSLVKTGAATEVTQNTATLNGTADPEGLSSTFYFEYGKTNKYGSTSSAPPGEGVGTTTPGDQPVSEGIEGLEPGATYHYRLVEVNSKGTSYGVDRTFTAETAVKHLSTDPAEPVGRVSATLKGTLDPDGMGTDYHFEWGRSKRYGEETPNEALADTSPGDQQVSAGIEGLKPETTYHFRLVAENATYGITKGQDRTVTTLPSIKDIATEAATEVEPTQATLNGSLDPDGFDTSFYFEYGKTKFYGHTIAAPPGDDVGTNEPGQLELSKTLEGLEPGTTYHFRIVAENETGSTAGGDETFKTPQGPSIEGVFSSEVSASSAKLRGRINPNGTEPSFETTYRFQYGTTTAYGNSVPVGDGTLSPTLGGQNVSVPISGLSEVTYHFRLVAENDWGKAVSEDQTLDFKPPSSCPNTTVRQQTGAAYLPDCRAYELVSPGRAGGALLNPNAPYSPYAANRFAFTGELNAIPGTGDPPNGISGDLYVASRTTEGWRTRYVGLSGGEALVQTGVPNVSSGNGAIPADRNLDTFLTWRGAVFNTAFTVPASYAPYRWDNEGDYLGRLPSNVGEVPGGEESSAEGGFTGDANLSADGNHYVFSSLGTAFVPGGVITEPGSVYDDEISTGTLSVVSKTATGANIPKDNSIATSGEYIRIPAVSRDGSHILMSTAAATPENPVEVPAMRHLYMSVDGSDRYEVSEGQDGKNHGVRFEGMSEDGTEVFFTTAIQMDVEDTDESVDLYRWSENGGSPMLERLSVGDEGSVGDTDSCSSLWTSRCDVEVVPTRNELTFDNLSAHTIDTAFAVRGEEIYFYSPEQLEGSRGTPGMRNLYVWHQGVLQHVTTLEAANSARATRINVSADGKFMAFVTKTKIDAYENAGHAEMYRYDPAARTMLCVSCKPDGSSPSSDVEGSQNGNFMTEDGRAFFSTEDALVPRDANGIRDVYEYVGGRAQLITTGTGDTEGAGGFDTTIGLVGVSADGTDAFVSTYETLVAQDENGPFLKFYDARVNGGFPFNKPPAPCAAADECHGEGSSSPVVPTIGTGAGLGAGGNVTEAAPRKQAKRRRAHCRRRAQRRHQARPRRRCHRRREARR